MGGPYLKTNENGRPEDTHPACRRDGKVPGLGRQETEGPASLVQAAGWRPTSKVTSRDLPSR